MMIKEYQTKNEIDRLVPLIREIWLEYYCAIVGREQVEYMLDRFQSTDAILDQMARKQSRYYGIFHRNEPAGYYAVEPSGENAVFLSKFYVAAKFRGAGLGKKMLRHLVEECVRSKKTRIWLTVNKNNDSSIAIYKKLGFTIVEEIVADIGNGFVMDDYKMEKRLDDVSDEAAMEMNVF